MHGRPFAGGDLCGPVPRRGVVAPSQSGQGALRDADNGAPGGRGAEEGSRPGPRFLPRPGQLRPGAVALRRCQYQERHGGTRKGPEAGTHFPVHVVQPGHRVQARRPLPGGDPPVRAHGGTGPQRARLPLQPRSALQPHRPPAGGSEAVRNRPRARPEAGCAPFPDLQRLSASGQGRRGQEGAGRIPEIQRGAEGRRRLRRYGVVFLRRALRSHRRAPGALRRRRGPRNASV